MCEKASEGVQVRVETKGGWKPLEEFDGVGWQQAWVQEGCRGLQSLIYMYSCCVWIKQTICISESSLYLNKKKTMNFRLTYITQPELTVLDDQTLRKQL